MLRRIIMVSLSAGAVALAAIGAFSKGAHAVASEAAQTTVPQPPTVAEVRTLALTEAARGGDGAPLAIEETTGTLGRAAAVTGGSAPSSEVIDPETEKPWSESAVDVVTMRGNFTINAPVPEGYPEPQGSVLTLIVDQRTGMVEGRQVSNAVPNLPAINIAVANLGE